MKFYPGLLTCVALACAGTADAHHSFAMYDNVGYRTIQGVVKSYTWRNPHASLELVTTSADGEQTWSVELQSINIISRRGWSSTSLKPGDRVPVTVHPMKDGSLAGLMVSVTTPDGQILKDKS